MRRIALPFLTLSDDSVALSEWTIGELGQPRFPLAEILEDWDYEKDLEIGVEVTVDLHQASLDLALDAASLKLAAVLVVGTGAGSLPRVTHYACIKIIDRGNTSVRLEATLAGHTLSSQLHLEIRILLDGPIASGSQLSPRFKGAKLWRTDLRVLLEDGGESRFPIELTSFTDSFQGMPEQNAPWYMQWDPSNFHADFGGNVRLYVNSDNEEIAHRFVDGDRILLQAIVADVMTQMITTALDQENEDDFLVTFEQGSIGQQTRVWIETAFSGQNRQSISAMRRNYPGRFHASILAAAELRGEE
ncbi:hypothetical protein OKW98_08425 [Pseudomonas sp. KU26590]|uniref:hypothetical protein n=1 Tax=Pseudomonas sp. KU26590 TaxID=2991051 RepID=UPI00223DFCCB|nr:hypothetical protein [Pseudomonas sp. KU26590]UZJ61727.1 hypothetical protein OKW98_08425 [Pseudomonas sp. KU26590]